MILNIRAIPKANRNLVKQDKDCLKVYLTQPPENGLANKQLIQVLAEHFNIRKYQIRIIKGGNSRDKLIEISDTLQDAGRK